MARRLGCVPLLALMVLQVPPASGAERATLISNVRFDELVGWCEDADAAKRSACSSYVLGVIDGRAVVDVEIGRRVLCYPDGTDLSVVVETIVAELKDGFRSDISPEQRMAPAAIPVQSIAQKHYACPPATTRLELRPASYDPAGSLSEMKVPGTGESIYVATEALLTNADVHSAQAVAGTDEPYVSVTLTFVGARLLRTWSAMNVGRPLAILVDGELVSAPIIREPLTGQEVSITGRFTPEAAEALARTIVAGSE